MGLVYANLELINEKDMFRFEEKYISLDKVRKLNCRMIVDSGAYMMAINETAKIQLCLEALRRQSALLADGSLVELEVVGPIRVNFENRTCTVDAYVIPGEAEMLLGAIPMEYMPARFPSIKNYESGGDVLIHPKENKLIVNPAHPTMPQLAMR